MQIKIHTDALHRIAYSTDASTYREVPKGVAYPKDEADIKYLVEIARKNKTHLIPRAGGTSIAGQVVGNGIVVDVSRYFNRILEINDRERWARVQPGVVRDELNIACKPYGLFFSPETSTSNRCCIGGMFGNNSCGSHSLVYGSTRHHVLEAHGVLADGTEEDFKAYSIGELQQRFGQEFWKNSSENDRLIQKIYTQLISFALNRDTVTLIRDSYPDISLRRRSCGYAIDEVIEDLIDDNNPFTERKINLCKLLCGSEGTLAFITEIKVDLDILSNFPKMAVCVHCNTLGKSYQANLICLKHRPDAVELIDGHILELSKKNGTQQANNFFVEGEPAGLLVADLSAPSVEELEAKAAAMENDLTQGKDALAYCCTRVNGEDITKVWNLRKAGLGLLSGMKGDAKPIGVIEDTAVAPERLPDYLREVDLMLHQLGLDCVYYGHISTGELHLRPIINIKTEKGLTLFRSVALETAKLVKKHKGSLSGEHGDGRLRGEFIPLLYGNAAYNLMREVKLCWDETSLLNMGKIIDTPPMDASLRFEINQSYEIEKEIVANGTYFNWKAAFDDCKMKQAGGVSSQLRGLMCSIEQCNGAGDCRKSNLIGGTLCPAFKVSDDELKTTRAKANALREILTRGWKSEAFTGLRQGKSLFELPELEEVLNSCLACKGCKNECPSNVDMTRLRAELLQQLYDKRGISLRSYMVARMTAIEKLGHTVYPLYNFFANWNISATLIKKVLKFSTKRDIPALNRYTMMQLVESERNKRGKKPTNGRKIYLFADEFTNYQEAELGLKFAQLLMNLGYEVKIPQHTESGRAAISKGDLKYAKRCAERNVNALKNIISEDAPLVGIEPSCILTFRDEYPDLVKTEERTHAQKLAKNCLLYDEFLFNELHKGYISCDSFQTQKIVVWLHGHCHQKALVGIEKTAGLLRSLLHVTVNVIPSGCCGMAGSFGYEKEHYKTSLEIGEMILFPTIRNAIKQQTDDVPMVVAAPGTSCRQQIKDGTGIKAVHPIEILFNLFNS